MPVLIDAIEPLREMAAENFITSEQKLMQAARRKGIVVNPSMVKIALRGNIGKQIFARPPRSAGESAAEQPGSRLQADLIDFSKNTKSKGYAEVVTDVFTRKTLAEPLATKDAASVKEATENTEQGP